MISDELYNKLDGDHLLRKYEKMVESLQEEIKTYKLLVESQKELIKAYKERSKR